MAYTAADFQRMVDAWAKSPDGKKEIRSAGINDTGYSQSEMREMAKELRDLVIAAYRSALTVSRGDFATAKIKVGTPLERKDGTWKIAVYFPPEALYRRSLYALNQQSGVARRFGGFTGPGIQDVFSMITSGYSARGSVFGEWWAGISGGASDNADGFIRSKQNREASPFIPDAVAQFEAAHPGVRVSYPEEWGGGSAARSHYYYIAPWA